MFTLLALTLTTGLTFLFSWHFLAVGLLKPMVFLAVWIYLLLLFLFKLTEKNRALNALDTYFKCILTTVTFTIIFYLFRTLEFSFGLYF